LVERRYIRALVLYNKTSFFYDGPQPRGLSYEALKEFEKFLNAKLNTGKQPVHMVFIPVTREDGLKRMQDGRGDIAVRTSDHFRTSGDDGFFRSGTRERESRSS
jgi:membrane-bound lytic murein transglycosylase MltF